MLTSGRSLATPITTLPDYAAAHFDHLEQVLSKLHHSAAPIALLAGPAYVRSAHFCSQNAARTRHHTATDPPSTPHTRATHLKLPHAPSPGFGDPHPGG